MKSTARTCLPGAAVTPDIVRRAAGDTKPQLMRALLPVVLLLCGAFVYCQVFVLPNVPRIANGDQGIYLHDAARMLQGELIYRDYDHFTFPGTDVLYAALFKVFGVRAWIAPAMLVLAAVALAWLSFRISRRVMTGATALLPGALFLVLPFSGYLDASHRWYSTLAALAALAVVIEERTAARLAWAGVFWGVAACFTQSVALGGLGVALFLLWERHREDESWKSLIKKEVSLFAGVLSAIAPFLSYFILEVGAKRFFYDTVVFVAKYYPADSFNSWRAYLTDHPSIRDWTRWPDLAAFSFIHLVIPLVYVLFLVRYWREARLRPEEPWNRLMLINLVGCFLFLGVIPSAGYMRLYTVALPALILVVWFLRAPFKIERALLWASWIVVLVLALARPAIIQTRWKAFLDLPTGRTAFLEHLLYEKCEWVSERTRPGDYFVDDPQISFALRLQNPTRVPFLRPTDYTRPEQVENVVQALRSHQVRFVAWYYDLDSGIDPAGDHLAPLRLYLQEHYHLAKTFPNGDAIWELGKGRSDR